MRLSQNAPQPYECFGLLILCGGSIRSGVLQPLAREGLSLEENPLIRVGGDEKGTVQCSST